jgi:hypothetical protein
MQEAIKNQDFTLRPPAADLVPVARDRHRVGKLPTENARVHRQDAADSNNNYKMVIIIREKNTIKIL